MRKVASKQSTAGMFSGNFIEKDKEFIASDQAFVFMNYIEGIPACWKKNFACCFGYGFGFFLWHFHQEIWNGIN